MEDLFNKYRLSEWPLVGCGRAYKPVALGLSQVVEIKHGHGDWVAMASGRLPSLLSDALKKAIHLKMRTTVDGTDPAEVYNILPNCFPNDAQDGELE